MKKFVAIFATVLTLCSCLVTSAFAVEHPSVYNSEFSVVVYCLSDGRYYYTSGTSYSSASVSVTDDHVKLRMVSNLGCYYSNDGVWVFDKEVQESSWDLEQNGVVLAEIVYSNVDIYDSDGNIYFGSMAVCDGSSCPATDADMNNVCDDCGQVLTMSLRSSLLDYAIQKHVPNGQSIYTNDTYWLICDNSEGGYTIYLSSEPLTYDREMNRLATNRGSVIHESSVIEMSSGQNGGRGWHTVSEENWVVPSGAGVDSNYVVDDFFPIPLWVTVEQATQGGDDGTGSEGTDNDGLLDSIGNWLSSIVDGITSVAQMVGNIPSLIIDGLKGFFTDVKNAVLSLPTLILDGIKSIFIPDKGYIETSFNSFLEEMKMKFNLDVSAFENLFQGESAVSDVHVDYDVPGVGNFNLKVFDSSYLAQGVGFFRPIIRGFLVLMMLLFHVKQLIGFFGYDAGVITGRSEWIGYNKANTGGHKE